MSDYTVRVDKITDTLSYAGRAAPGSATNLPVWRIFKIEISGPSITTLYADGNALFDNIWDDRLSLSYS